MRLLLFVAAALVGSITGTIKTDQGRPAANVVVAVEGSPVSVRTDGSGRFTIPGVPLGNQKIRIQVEGHTDVVLPVPVHAGENTIGLLTLQPEMPVTRGGGGQVVAPRVKPPGFLRFTYRADCDSSVSSADSTRSWGTCSARGDSLPVTVAFQPAGKLPSLTIVVLAADGAVVRRLRDGRAEVASSRTWDGRDEKGHLVSPGNYVVRFATGRDSVDIPFCARR
jgi:hypothetical protein